MLETKVDKESLFRELYLFSFLEDSQLAQAAKRFEVQSLAQGEVLFSQGDVGNSFYIIYKGQVAVTRSVGEEEKHLGVLIEEDFFGEVALLSDSPRTATITAVVPTTLLCIDRPNFEKLIKDFPRIKVSLERIITSRRIAEKHKRWVGQDEVIYQVRRKHITFLIFKLLLPLILLTVSSGVGLVGSSESISPSYSKIILIVAGSLAGLAVLWGLWRWIDWSNDFYIVTNQRVIWIEQIMWLYESRVEAPLNAVLSVKVVSSFIGRLFGFGNILVRTFTGEVTIRHVGDPNQMAVMIEEYWHRVQRSYQRGEELEMERSVRRILGDGETIEETPFEEVDGDVYKEPSIWQKYFGNIFKVRFEDGNTITYRKHWLFFFEQAWKPGIATMLLFGIVATVGYMYFSNGLEYSYAMVVFLAGPILFALILLPWWAYHYIDWRNDIYQVTDKNIFDIDRKPFGTEVRKSASLENILSLEHERPGILGYIFNVGNVTINIGEAQFTFDGVHEPARIQQDVFDRMFLLRRQKEKAEVARERDRIVNLLDVYHRSVSRNVLHQNASNEDDD